MATHKERLQRALLELDTPWPSPVEKIEGIITAYFGDDEVYVKREHNDEERELGNDMFGLVFDGPNGSTIVVDFVPLKSEEE